MLSMGRVAGTPRAISPSSRPRPIRNIGAATAWNVETTPKFGSRASRLSRWVVPERAKPWMYRGGLSMATRAIRDGL